MNNRLKIVEINTDDFGSTGKIMLQIAEKARENDVVVETFSRGWKNKKQVAQGHNYFGSFPENGFHIVASFLIGYSEVFSIFGTVSLVHKINRIKPDIIHLHNLHKWYICLPLLFNYIKRKNIPVVWTLHDCWSFTGHCPYFDMVKCSKWQSMCYSCPQYKEYPESLFDNSRIMFKLKKKWFTGIPQMTLVSPSHWLAGLVKKSFLKDYPVVVIHNGIDLNTFKRTSPSDKISRILCIGNERKDENKKYLIVGVAFGWGKRKGLDVFIELANRLPDYYQIALVGTDDEADEIIPGNVISVHMTDNQSELAEIYSAADLLVNPTREDNYPTVNMEALACGTPIITFNTGGSPECLDETCGSVVDCDDIDSLKEEIIFRCEKKPFDKDACIERAKFFDAEKMYLEYLNLYRTLTSR